MGTAERKEREKIQRKEDILDAAEKVFFEKGLGLATMDEIAEKAELSKGTLYLYYKSKEDLYMAIICRGHEILLKMFEEAAATGEPTTKLFQNIGEAYYTFYKRHHDYFRMFSFSENTQLHSQVSEEMRSACAESGQCIGDLVVGVIKKGQEDGTFRPEVNPREMAVIFWANSWGVMKIIDHFSSIPANEMRGECGQIDFEKMYRKSGALLLYAILTEEAKKNYQPEFQLTGKLN
ncbi:MAG: TetR/AcrR family transcriptional regulator [candidate division Zixibacteria bacterium]|nr:TetR/AcrR family transcriptional regulator [candidate division Zixibacteria bacterium]